MASQAEAVIKYLQMEIGLLLEVKPRLQTAVARAEIAKIMD